MPVQKLFDLLIKEKEKNNLIGEIIFNVDDIKWSYYRVDTHGSVEDICDTDIAQIEHIIFNNNLNDDITIMQPEYDEDYAYFYMYS